MPAATFMKDPTWPERGEVRLRLREAMPTIADRQRADCEARRVQALNWLIAYRRRADAHPDAKAEVEAFLTQEGRAIGARIFLSDDPLTAMAEFLGAWPKKRGRPPADNDAFCEEVHWLRTCGFTLRDAVAAAAAVVDDRGHRLGGNRTMDRLRKAYQADCRARWTTLQATVAMRHMERESIPIRALAPPPHRRPRAISTS